MDNDAIIRAEIPDLGSNNILRDCVLIIPLTNVPTLATNDP